MANRMQSFLMEDKMMHTLQLAMILIVATALILLGHSYIPPELVFTGMIGGLAGIVGTRIASNGYVNAPPAPAPPTPPTPLPPPVEPITK